MGTEQRRDWDGHDWASVEHPADEKRGPQWDEREWAGEAPDKSTTEHASGGSGVTGGGHGSGEQHWAPDKD